MGHTYIAFEYHIVHGIYLNQVQHLPSTLAIWIVEYVELAQRISLRQSVHILDTRLFFSSVANNAIPH